MCPLRDLCAELSGCLLYTSLSLLEDFEKEYDCTIVYETFESNEMMYTKLSSGETYDVLIPVSYTHLHDQEEAINMSDRIAVMKDGRIEQIGTPDEIYNHPKTSYVATFVGDVYKRQVLGDRDSCFAIS